MIVAIDGPAGTGKSTIAKKLAKTLGFVYFDTGAMYRSFTYLLIKNKIAVSDDKKIRKILKEFVFDVQRDEEGQRFFANGEDVSSVIRTAEVTELVSAVSVKKYLRQKMVRLQRKFAKNNHTVIEGRDIGTKVFPKAEVKFFLTATANVRAQRRYDQYLEKFPEMKSIISFDKILSDIQKRDQTDSNRKISPLKQAEDAFLIDSSNMTIEEVLDTMLEDVNKVLISKRRYIQGKMKFFYKMVCKTCYLLLRLFYRIEIYGQNYFIKGGAIVAPNHVSNFDPPIIAATSPEEIHFMAKASLFNIPILSALIRKLNAHPVSIGKSNLKAMKDLAKIIKEGNKILLFPEGNRSKTGEIQDFMPGVVFLSFQGNIPIIPAYILGSYKAWPRHKKFPKLFGKMICCYGKPIFPNDFLVEGSKQKTIEALLKELRLEMDKLEAFCQTRMKKF
ncbi:MAG TPA: (d)CMP kinase [Chlamydiales bacterium]|nr:(d)CMP kinase [Chlamydiales bacterium]